jgi:TetR/AcrR family transcriptional regulator, cholesterol catabolism regulator
MAFTEIPTILSVRRIRPPSPPLPAARATDARPNMPEKRRQLRDAAASLFAEHGAAGASLQGLARRAGIGPGRVTYYYDGKPDLLAEIMHDHLAALGLRVDVAAAAEAGGRPEDQLQAMVLAYLEGVQADRAAHLVLMQERPSLTEAERRIVTARYKLLAYSFRDPLIAAVPGLRPHPDLARVVALTLAGMASNTAFWFRAEGSVALPAYAALLLRMAVTGARGLGRQGRRRERAAERCADR